jgi:hypothetical protein
LLVLVAALAGAAAAPLRAQEPPVAQEPVAPYRPPVIALVQPPAMGSVQSDKPILVFRFAAGEPGDPIDVGSFAITVDGADRTPLFQVTATEAWGPLRQVDPRAAPNPDAAASHDVAARICSARGACASVTATVSVSASPAVAAPETASRREGWLDLLLRAARRLLIP